MVRILYIDDEPSLLTLTQIYLKEEADFDVDTAESAEDGLLMLHTEAYDAVVSDYDMPDMNGIELLKCVRDENALIPFIIFTGKGREEVVIEALNNGADFYLQKGGDPKPLFTELANAIRHLVRRSRAEDSALQSEKNWQEISRSVNLNLDAIEDALKHLLSLTTNAPEAIDDAEQIRRAMDHIRTGIPGDNGSEKET